MLRIFGPQDTSKLFCDKISRRNILKIGGLGAAGLSLPGFLEMEANAGIRNSHKSVILIYLVGGPPHQDMFDLKPDAPSNIAGPHKPMKTNVPGINICEQFPMMAKRMDKFAVIRSMHFSVTREESPPMLRRPVVGRRWAVWLASYKGPLIVQRLRLSACATSVRMAHTTNRDPECWVFRIRRFGR